MANPNTSLASGLGGVVQFDMVTGLNGLNSFNGVHGMSNSGNGTGNGSMPPLRSWSSNNVIGDRQGEVKTQRIAASFAPSAQMHKAFMQKMWEDRSFCDVSLNCCDGCLEAHRCVLAAASPVFAAMLGGGMKEAQTQVIEITDHSLRTVEAAVCFIYTSQMADDADLGKLLAWAHRYEIEDLIKFVSNKLSLEVSPENVADVVASLRHLTNHIAVQSAFKMVLSKVQEDSSLIEAMARNL